MCVSHTKLFITNMVASSMTIKAILRINRQTLAWTQHIPLGGNLIEIFFQTKQSIAWKCDVVVCGTVHSSSIPAWVSTRDTIEYIRCASVCTSAIAVCSRKWSFNCYYSCAGAETCMVPRNRLAASDGKRNAIETFDSTSFKSESAAVALIKAVLVGTSISNEI